MKTKAALLVSALVLAGCGANGKQEYDIGVQLNSAQKYQQAIQYIEKAMSKEPGNAQYRAKLAQVKSSLVAQLVDQARAALNQTPLTIDAINTAEANAKKAAKVQSGGSVAQLNNDVQASKKSFLESVANQYQTAVANVDAGNWPQAVDGLKAVQAVYPNYEQSVQLLTKAVNQGAAGLVAQARAALKNDEIGESILLLKDALKVNPALGEAASLLELAEKNNNKEYFLARAKKAEAFNDWEKAEQAYTKALDYDQFDSVVMDKLQRVRVNKELKLINFANGQLTAGYLQKSVNAYAQAADYSYDENKTQLAALKQFLSATINQEIERFSDKGQLGSAYYWATLLEKVNPQFKGLFARKQELEDRIYNRVRKSIAVFDFRSPSNNDDAGILIANNLISYLFNNASKDITILERENLKSILEEMKLGQIGVVSENTAKEMGRIYGIDIAIMGSVLLFKVDSTSAISNKTARYIVGESIEDNIEYLNWKARNPKATAEALRNAPVAKIKVPKYAEKDYEVQQQKKVGFIQLSYRIVDVATGVNTSVETIERKNVAEDTANAGIADAKIRFDPMEIPTDTEMLQNMTAEVVDELAREVLKPMTNLEKQYFQQGEELLNRRKEAISAVEQFTNAIFDEKLKSISSPITEQANQYVTQVFENYKF